MGRDDSRQLKKRLLHHSFFRAADDQAEVRQDYSHQLHRRAARRILSHALRRLQGRHYQPGEGACNGTRATQHPGELRGARLGGHGHVQRGNQLESGRKSHCLRYSPASRGHCGGNCRTDFVPRFGSGQLHDWRNHQCKRGSGVVRLKAVNFWPVLALAALMTALPLQAARAQNPDNMMPEERTAKGKQVLEQLITALGGPTYLDIRESNCDGRLAQFGHNGEMTGYTNFKVYWRYPDKNRTDFSKKGVIVNVYNGDRGWTLDRGGVSELSNAAVADFQEQAKRDVNNLLRVRLKEPGMTIRFGGTDVVDLRTVDWVEITDTEQRDFRLAVDRTTHYLVRTVVTLADDTSPDRSVETHIYTNYQLMDGVQTPLQITLDRNGRRVNQVFFQSCKYNPGFSDDFFTKAALDKRFSEVGSKKYKDEKKREKEAEKDN